ncbi:MAG: hypothetical protein ACI8R4_001016 [Paracoccaceae bacterium]
MIRAGLFAMALATLPGASTAQCRQALVMGLDVSGSIDANEYRLQLDGLAGALLNPEVAQALLVQPAAPVHLAVFEWSGPAYQRILLDWTPITDPATLAQVASHLTSRHRAPAPPGTALGSAMQFGAALLADKPDCWKRTFDISGDGKHNFGPHPRDVQHTLSTLPITLNALAIGSDSPPLGDTRQVEIAELSSYFSAWVISGPGAFVETAQGYHDYRAAMIRKLKRELQGLVVSALPAETP